jgi:hypothetical protein
MLDAETLLYSGVMIFPLCKLIKALLNNAILQPTFKCCPPLVTITSGPQSYHYVLSLLEFHKDRAFLLSQAEPEIYFFPSNTEILNLSTETKAHGKILIKYSCKRKKITTKMRIQ